MTFQYLIREYRSEDFDAVTFLWRFAREKLLPEGVTDTGHCFYEDREYFRSQILKKDRIWVVEIDNRPAAFMAVENDFIDQLYVHPRYQRRGIGETLAHAGLDPDKDLTISYGGFAQSVPLLLARGGERQQGHRGQTQERA